LPQFGVFPFPPAPTATTETEVTPAGATHEYVPGVVYDCDPAADGVVTELLAELQGPVPYELVALTLNV
jgi:hypothetical protein